MKKKYPSVVRELRNLFKEIYPNEKEYEKAVKEAMKAFSWIKQDELYKAYETKTQNI